MKLARLARTNSYSSAIADICEMAPIYLPPYLSICFARPRIPYVRTQFHFTTCQCIDGREHVANVVAIINLNFKTTVKH